MLDSQGAHLMTKMEHSQVAEAAEKCRDLEKRFRVVEGFNALRIDDMCLVQIWLYSRSLKYPTSRTTKGIASQDTI